MRIRLRDSYGPDELAALYPKPHDHTRWPDHRLRVAVTADVARFMYRGGPVADLSCGDGAITRLLEPQSLILGDFAPGYPLHGPIERTVEDIPSVDLFLCCETIEHLDDPDGVLARIREKTRALVVSTPDGETEPRNAEHYWGWDSGAVEDMLLGAGFNPVVYMSLAVPTLGVTFQVWGCE